MTQITFCMIKPDAMQANQEELIIKHITDEGFEIVNTMTITLTSEQADDLYTEHKERSFYPEIKEFILSGDVRVMLLSRENAVLHLRNIMGATHSAQAEPHTIRGKYGNKEDIMRNCIHGSDSEESAKRESAIFFVTA